MRWPRGGATLTAVADESQASILERRLSALERFYGLLPTPPRDPFALFVWEVLAAQTTPGRRDAAFGALKRARTLTPDAMARAPRAKLEAALALAGAYGEQRLHAIKVGVNLFRRSPRLSRAITGPLPAARRALAALPTLDDGGAHRMLLFAADRPVMPLDRPVHRVGLRLGLGHPRRRERGTIRSVRQAIVRGLPPTPEAYRRAFLYLSHHATATCTEVEPHCNVCPLAPECPEGQRRRHTSDA